MGDDKEKIRWVLRKSEPRQIWRWRDAPNRKELWSIFTWLRPYLRIEAKLCREPGNALVRFYLVEWYERDEYRQSVIGEGKGAVSDVESLYGQALRDARVCMDEIGYAEIQRLERLAREYSFVRMFEWCKSGP